MLAFRIFMAVPLADYFLSMKEKHQKLFVSESCLFTSLTINCTIKHEVEVTENTLCQFSTRNALITSEIKRKGNYRIYCQQVCYLQMILVGMETQKGFYSRNYMLALPLIMSVTSADEYFSTKDKQKTFQVCSSYIFTLLRVNETIEQQMKVIADILCQFSTRNTLMFS